MNVKLRLIAQPFNYGYLPAMADILTLMVNKIAPSIDYIWHKTFKNAAMGLEFNIEALNKKYYNWRMPLSLCIEGGIF